MRILLVLLAVITLYGCTPLPSYGRLETALSARLGPSSNIRILRLETLSNQQWGVATVSDGAETSMVIFQYMERRRGYVTSYISTTQIDNPPVNGVVTISGTSEFRAGLVEDKGIYEVECEYHDGVKVRDAVSNGVFVLAREGVDAAKCRTITTYSQQGEILATIPLD